MVDEPQSPTQAIQLAVARLEGKIDVLTEKVEGQNASLRERITFGDDSVRSQVVLVEERVVSLEHRVTGVEGRVTALEPRTEGVPEKLAKFESELESLKLWRARVYGGAAVTSGAVASVVVAIAKAAGLL